MTKIKVEKSSHSSKQLLMNRAAGHLKKKKFHLRRTGLRVDIPYDNRSVSYIAADRLKTSMSLGHLDTIQELNTDSNIQANKIFIGKIKNSDIRKQKKSQCEQDILNSLLTINKSEMNQNNEMIYFKSIRNEITDLNNINQKQNLERFKEKSLKEQNLIKNIKEDQILHFNNSRPKSDDALDNVLTSNIVVGERSLAMLGGARPALKDLFLLKFAQLNDWYLNYAEIAVLSTVIEKKFNTQLPVKSVYSLLDFKYLAGIQSTKRPEESYKFVFKYAFKSLKERFCESTGLDVSTIKKPQVFVHFYNYYFGDVSSNSNIDIESFYLPLTPDTYGLDLNNVAAKTINATYVRLIIKSKAFLTDFMEFVNEKFRDEYINLIPKKIDNMIDKLEQSFENAWYNDRYIDIICDNIRSNKRCKLPWTVKELDYAIRQTNKLISKNLSKNNR